MASVKCMQVKNFLHGIEFIILFLYFMSVHA